MPFTDSFGHNGHTFNIANRRFVSAPVKPILQLLKETGMRIGEAATLKWRDINFKNNTIILNELEKKQQPKNLQGFNQTTEYAKRFT